MEKYNTSTFKNVLACKLSDEETAALWDDPVFEQEFSFYLQIRQGGQQLIDKYTSADANITEQDNVGVKVKPLSSKLAMAASVALALLGGYMLVPSGDVMMGGQSSFLEQYGLGIGLIAAAMAVFYFFRKK